MSPLKPTLLNPRGGRQPLNLAATLTSAGLDDPDILALAAEADALRLQQKLPLKTSRAGVDELSLDGSPDSPLIGTMPASPVKSPTVDNTRSGRLSPPPSRRPAAVSTYAASAAARKNSTDTPINSSSIPTAQPSNGGYAAAAAANRATSPDSRGAPMPVVSATLFRMSSLGSQQQQQPPHAVAFGTTVPVSSVPNAPTRKISGSGAMSPPLTRRSSLGKEPTYSVAFGSTIPRDGAVSPTRNTLPCSITRQSSLPTSGSLSRQNSASNFQNTLALFRRSSMGAPANGVVSRKNSLGSEPSRPRDASSSGVQVAVNSRTESKTNIGCGRQPASASPARTGRTSGHVCVYDGAAQPATTTQAVTSPFAAAAALRPIESPTPKIVHSTFNIDSSIAKFDALGQKTAGDADSAAAGVAEAAAGSSKHRRVPSLPVWPPEQANESERASDVYKHHQETSNQECPSAAAAAAMKPCRAPTPAQLPAEMAAEVQVHYTTADINHVAYNAGKKLPVLKEELSINTLNSSGGSGAIGALTNLFTGGSKKSQQQGSSETPRGENPTDGSFGGATKDKAGITIHTTAGNGRMSGSSTNSSDEDFYNNSNRKRCRGRLACLGLPLLLLVVVAAVVGGIYGVQRQNHKAVQDVMLFQISMAAPAKTTAQGCATWFGSDERIATFQRLVSAAYANALDVPVDETTVNSISCGGSSVYSDGVRYTSESSRSARLLLSKMEFGAARSLQQLSLGSSTASTPTWVEIATIFSVPAPSDLARRSDILETVSSTSTGILAGPLSQFLGVESLMVRSADPVAASTDRIRGAQAPVVTPAEGSEELTPESGEVQFEMPTDFSTESNSDQTQFTGVSVDGAGGADVDTVTVSASAAARPPTELELSTHPWNPIKRFEAYAEAPACLFSPTRTNTITDARGRLWSLLDGRECAFRPQTDNARIGKVPITWDTADICLEPPTTSNFVLDAAGRMWGWQKDKTCAFRARYPPAPGTVAAVLNAQPLAVPNKISVVWDNAPLCPFAPSSTNIVADTFGRLWSWDNGKSCAFRFAD